MTIDVTGIETIELSDPEGICAKSLSEKRNPPIIMPRPEPPPPVLLPTPMPVNPAWGDKYRGFPDHTTSAPTPRWWRRTAGDGEAASQRTAIRAAYTRQGDEKWRI